VYPRAVRRFNRYLCRYLLTTFGGSAGRSVDDDGRVLEYLTLPRHHLDKSKLHKHHVRRFPKSASCASFKRRRKPDKAPQISWQARARKRRLTRFHVSMSIRRGSASCWNPCDDSGVERSGLLLSCQNVDSDIRGLVIASCCPTWKTAGDLDLQSSF
jgi:hypothetical protein